jgi:Protein of unknown function (DUF1566)
MRLLGRFILTIVLLLAPLAGCDGRGGSSGLDITSENAAISQALETRQCLDFQKLRVCPAGEPAAATPTPGGAPSVETSLGNATSIDCFQSIPGGPCTFTLQFVPRAFPSNTTFEALARPDASSNPWVLGPDPVADSGTGEVSYAATLVLTSVQGGPPNQVQLAVLAFAGPSSSSPTEVQDLHQTAATFAFVTQVLAVNVVTPTMTPTPTGRPTNTPTPTRTPGASDCCQCPSSCAAPVDGACGSCTVVFGATCYGEMLCTLRTPAPTLTPSPTPTPCLTDNGDGTITDGCTGLMWEKKDQAGGLHDYSTSYPWAGVCDGDLLRTPCQPDAASAAACTQATNGAVGCSQCAAGSCTFNQVPGPYPTMITPTSTIWGWLAQLNQGAGFAGHTDWRVPSVGKEGDTAELETILLSTCTVGEPCVPSVFYSFCAPGAMCGTSSACSAGEICVYRPGDFNGSCQTSPGCTVTSCSCTWGMYYWSATSVVSTPDLPLGSAFNVGFFANGGVRSASKDAAESVRAVRGIAIPTPTNTPGTNDCCQCPSSCAAPANGTCGSCTAVFGAACDGGPGCSQRSPTPTPTPTPCLKDNGDGTISDGCTKLMWEKKDDAGGLHEYTTFYTWAGACSGNTALCQPNAGASLACTTQTGDAVGCDQCASGTCIVDPDHSGAATTIWDWLNQLNASGFAGYNDWRIPTVGYQGDMPELETLLPPKSDPCLAVPPVFNTNCDPNNPSTLGCSVTSCSCTASSYWSATTFLPEPGTAESVFFLYCGSFGSGGIFKTQGYSVRAVRSGL